MQWRKQGLLYRPQANAWMVSHASLPFAEPLRGNHIKVYFSGRDKQNKSQAGSFEVDITRPGKIHNFSSKPILSYGEPGTFDDAGSMASWVVNCRDKKYLYYIGWNLGVSVPFRNAIGLAVSEDGGKSFKKISRGPVLDRDLVDPGFVASPCVLIESNIWRMWYLGCTGWEIYQGELRHRYRICYAESEDEIGRAHV